MDQERFMRSLANFRSPAVESLVGSNLQTNTDITQLFEKRLCNFITVHNKEISKPTSIPKPNAVLTSGELPVMPPEMFRDELPLIKRRQLFFQYLKRRDILYLQVINTKDSESYKCLVLAKHGEVSKLEDLSLVVHFPKLEPELKILNGFIQKFDLIRGAFWSVNVWERKMYVTLDTSVFNEQEKEKIPKLGRITRFDLPYFVNSKRPGNTYAGYVQRSQGFVEAGFCLKELQKCWGLDVNRIYSFHEGMNGKSFPASESFTELRKKLHPDASNTRLYRSFEYFRNGNMFKAFYYANKAIMYNPDNIQARVTRGTVYANLGKLNKAFIDTEDSLKLNPKHESARKQMSELLVSASRVYLLNRKYLRWHQSLRLAKTYNPKNREVQLLLMRAKYETGASRSNNRRPPNYLIPPSMAEVAPIYDRVCPRVDKRRLLKHYKKQKRRRRRQERRRRRAERRRKRASETSEPIPVTPPRRYALPPNPVATTPPRRYALPPSPPRRYASPHSPPRRYASPPSPPRRYASSPSPPRRYASPPSPPRRYALPSSPAATTSRRQDFQPSVVSNIAPRRQVFQSTSVVATAPRRHAPQSTSVPTISPRRPEFQSTSATTISPRRPDFQSTSATTISPRRQDFQSTAYLSQRRHDFQSTSVISQRRHDFQSTSVISPRRPDFQSPSSVTTYPRRQDFQSSSAATTYPRRQDFHSTSVDNISPRRQVFFNTSVSTNASRRQAFQPTPVTTDVPRRQVFLNTSVSANTSRRQTSHPTSLTSSRRQAFESLSVTSIDSRRQSFRSVSPEFRRPYPPPSRSVSRR